MSLLFNALLFAQGTAPSAPAGTQQKGGLMGGFLVPMLLLFLIWYLLLIRPQQKKEKQRLAMINNLKKGDRVMTTSGMYGEVIETRNNIVVLRIAKDVTVEFAKSAISGAVQQQGDHPQIVK